jgi:hypothetical protein
MKYIDTSVALKWVHQKIEHVYVEDIPSGCSDSMYESGRQTGDGEALTEVYEHLESLSVDAKEMESCMRFQRFIYAQGIYVQDAHGKWWEYGHVTGKDSDVIPVEEIWNQYNESLRLSEGGIS